MAFSKSVSREIPGFPGPIVAEDVYFRIVSVNGGKQGMQVLVAGTKDGIVLEELTSTFMPDLEGPNFIAQGYQHLNTLPEFAEAVDC